MSPSQPAGIDDFFDALRARNALPPVVVDLMQHAHAGLPAPSDDTDPKDAKRTRMRCKQLIDLCARQAQSAAGSAKKAWAAAAKGFERVHDEDLHPGHGRVSDLFFWDKLIDSLS